MSVPSAVQVVSATALATSRELIAGPREMVLPQVCVTNTIAAFNPGFARHMERDIYAARPVSFSALELLHLPAGVTVHPSLDFVALLGDVFIAEQFLGNPATPQPHQVQALTADTAVEDVAGPCLLVGRFGYWTWGHWLGELLLRVVAAEAIAPGKFRFAVPAVTTNPDWDAPLPRNILGSLAAYGIGLDRLVRLDYGRRYRFADLSIVSNPWVYPYALHPAAHSLLRHSLRQRVPRFNAPKAAMLRLDGTKRGILNQEEVANLLRSKGFSLVNVGALPFIEQVAAFQQAESVFGILGSNLTGLLYSPFGAQVVTAAPGDWGDCFFHGLVQCLDGRFADLRGTPAQQDPGSKIFSNFTLQLATLAAGLEAVEAG
jgi:hypothetical protein